jgi:hypothetical protein
MKGWPKTSIPHKEYLSKAKLRFLNRVYIKKEHLHQSQEEQQPIVVATSESAMALDD